MFQTCVAVRLHASEKKAERQRLGAMWRLPTYFTTAALWEARCTPPPDHLTLFLLLSGGKRTSASGGRS